VRLDRRLIAAVTAACVSTVVAAVSTGRRGWIAVGEFAQAEFRIRGFWSAPPQLGAFGRLSVDGVWTQHPGPLAWWAMYPVYSVMGGGGAALSWATAAMAVFWVAAAVVIAARHGGLAAGLAVAVTWVLVLRAIGTRLVVEPWNPWFAVPPFLCMVIATWATVRGSNRSFAIVVVAGSIAVQAHLGYLPFALAAGVTALICVVRRRDWTWLAISAAAVVGCWSLPFRQQIIGESGNLGQIVRAFTEPGEPPAGWATATRVTLSTLDLWGPWWIGIDRPPDEASVGVGTLLFFIVWIGAVTVAVRRKDLALVQLHSVLAGGVVVGFLATSRILGTVHDYLVPWWSVVAGLIMATSMCTFWRATEPWRAEHAPRPWRTAATAVVAGCVGVGIGAALAPHIPGGRLSGSTSDLVEQLAGRVDASASYLVRWEDPASFGAIGYGIVGDLDRRGVEVGGVPFFRPALTERLVASESGGRPELVVVSGARLADWQEWPSARRLAMTDPRSPDERRAWPSIRASLRRELGRIGGDELADRLDTNVFLTRSDPRVSAELRDRIDAFAEVGLPTGVFQVPPGDAGPPA